MARGRKRKYEDAGPDFKELVYLYRKENPSGNITFRGIANFSKELFENGAFHTWFNEDAWKTYGREFVEKGNNVIKTKLTTKSSGVKIIPNVSDVVKKFSDKPEKIISILEPMERQMHESFLEIDEKNEELSKLKQELKEKDNLIKRYEEFVGQMAHHSYMKSFQDEYGLINQIDMGVNRSKRVEEAIDNTQDIGSFMDVTEKHRDESEETKDKLKTKSNVTDMWQSIKEKKKIK